ncbi:transcription factor FER-LIKE IRON DEFICIENCY-INDUCED TRANSCRIPTION FACTOR [Canna indica]|uniref:Transcription factor FER-LIKE IRON DEFICIENCY-INDUCED TRANSCRIPTION FACTOR n=1 Tax=Canna indica TaxID=4628 RepID=A0AAQ3KSR2_9LILI|nr:transcription factor FER-LIKE IRON DEFICIENCY-INDUCED TRANSCRIPTION FACTOR [Canna indica]
MENDYEHLLFFSPQSNLITSISHGVSAGNDDDVDYLVDPIMANCLQGDDFNEFVLFDCGGGGLAIDGDVDRLRFLREEGSVADQAASVDHLGGADPVVLNDEDTPESEGGGQEDGDEDGDSSSLGAAKTRRDRKKTLISERKRRVRMKESLYELRSLVPTITKMDKASIIADAVVYVKDLQSQAKKLVEEISMLESSPSKEERVVQISRRNKNKENKVAEVGEKKNAAAVLREEISKIIVEVKAYELGERRFCVKVEGRMGEGTGTPSSSLYSALVSLSCFVHESSSFSVDSHGFLFTTILRVGEVMNKEMNSVSMELLVMGALLKEGFHFSKHANY